MRTLINLALIVAIAVLSILVEEAGVQTSLDRALKEIRYNISSQDPSNEVVLVEIDSKSLQELNVWPWPRSYHAQVLNNLMDMGAEEIAFDIDFSSYSNAEDDAAFADALKLAGGYTYLAAFDQVSGITGEILRTRPIPDFADHAYPALVNVLLDRDGFAYSFPTLGRLNGFVVESMATSLSHPDYTPPPVMLLDFSIDLTKIQRISYVDIFEGKIDPVRIFGKRIIIGASAVELQDLFKIPRFGVVPGPLLQILAIETVQSGRVLNDWGYWPSVAMMLTIVLLGVFLRQKLGLIGLAIGAGAAIIIWELTAIAFFAMFGILINTVVFYFSVPLALVAQIVNEALIWLNQRRALQKRLQHLARYDEITNVHTRAGFIERMGQGSEQDLETTIILIAIKRLEMVRGALGQDIGDQSLAQIAARLQELADAPVGLVSQDVFAVGFDGQMSEEEIEDFTEQVNFKLTEPIELGEHSVIIDTHFSLAQKTDEGRNITQILNHAEIALTATKAKPGSRIAKFQPKLIADITARQHMDLELRKAIARNEFRLAFQPQVSLASEKLVGIEALIRWHHPEMGIVSPAQFIPLAEETGFIVQLGEWVIEEACRITAPWNWEGTLSVNVSAIQLELCNVPAIVARAEKKTGYPASRLEIEITESVLVGDTERVKADLKAFQALGCSVAIDDFGTGYSSLSYLSDLPFDKLKIDQSFVRFIDQNKGNRSIVESIIHLARQLGKKTVAEGIETETEANILKQLKCDIAQGYFYGRPIDALTLSKMVSPVQDNANQA